MCTRAAYKQTLTSKRAAERSRSRDGERVIVGGRDQALSKCGLKPTRKNERANMICDANQRDGRPLCAALSEISSMAEEDADQGSRLPPAFVGYPLDPTR